MRKAVMAFACFALAACSHLPFFAKKEVASGKIVGVVEYDTGLTRFSTITGIYHQDMCSKQNGDAPVHLRDKEMKRILKAAQKSGFYKTPSDLRYWTGSGQLPPRCAIFRLRIESGDLHNEVRWDCGRDGSNAPPRQVAPVVEQVQKILRAHAEVRDLPWSSCQVQ